MAPKRKTYIIYGKLMVDTTVSLAAASLADAVEQAKALDVHDFVEILGEHNDSSLKVYGVYEETP